MVDVPQNAPSTCPGTADEAAGKSTACAGCPNQKICASGAGKMSLEEREPDNIRNLRERMRKIRHKLMILSGKGGVGKSSVSVCLARGLTRRMRNSTSKQSNKALEHGNCNSVGILDLDICGPSIPCLTGCLDSQVQQTKDGIMPVYVTENLLAMSVGFLLESPDQAVVWRGPRKSAMITQLLTKVCWTDQKDEQDDDDDVLMDDEEKLDFLIVDMPPGTSDEHLSLAQYLKAVDCLDYVIIVTTPQEVALCDVRKEVNFCKKVGLKILGVVENMSEFVCPSCHKSSEVFPHTSGGAQTLCGQEVSEAGDALEPRDHNLELLGKLPLDPRLARCLDEGECPFEEASGEHDFDENGTGAPEGFRQHLKETDSIILAYNQMIDNILKKLSTISI